MARRDLSLVIKHFLNGESWRIGKGFLFFVNSKSNESCPFHLYSFAKRRIKRKEYEKIMAEYLDESKVFAIFLIVREVKFWLLRKFFADKTLL